VLLIFREKGILSKHLDGRISSKNTYRLQTFSIVIFLVQQKILEINFKRSFLFSEYLPWCNQSVAVSSKKVKGILIKFAIRNFRLHLIIQYSELKFIWKSFLMNFLNSSWMNYMSSFKDCKRAKHLSDDVYLYFVQVLKSSKFDYFEKFF